MPFILLKKKKKRKLQEIDQKITHRLDPRKTQMVTLSLKSFIYDLSDTFCFPQKETSEFYKKYLIEKVEIFHMLTETDSTALKFIFLSDPNSDIPKEKFRDIIFEVIVVSEIYKRLDTSHEFWNIFGARKESRRKKVGYYETENISNPYLLTLAVNPKEYLEMLTDLLLNKKHKGIKKGSTEQGFENFSQRIESLVNFETFEKPPLDKKGVLKFSVIQGKMVKKQ